MNAMYELFMNLFSNGASGKGDWDAFTDAMEAEDNAKTVEEKEIARFDQARYMSGIIVSMISTINDLIGSRNINGIDIITYQESLKNTARSLTKTLYMIEQDAKIDKNYRMSRVTVYQTLETVTMVVNDLTSIPGLNKHPMILAINAGANVIGALAASSAKTYGIDFRETEKKITELFNQYGIDIGAETSKIINTNNSEKYVGDNWTLIAPFTDDLCCQI